MRHHHEGCQAPQNSPAEIRSRFISWIISDVRRHDDGTGGIKELEDYGRKPHALPSNRVQIENRSSPAFQTGSIFTQKEKIRKSEINLAFLVFFYKNCVGFV